MHHTAPPCPAGPHGRQLFTVYVLELPDGSLYVGSTAKSDRERAAEHGMSGRRGRLRRDLAPKRVCATRERAEGIERRVAARLRARGHHVTQG